MLLVLALLGAEGPGFSPLYSAIKFSRQEAAKIMIKTVAELPRKKIIAMCCFFIIIEKQNVIS